MPNVILDNSAESGSPLDGVPTIGVELEVEYNGNNVSISEKAMEVSTALNSNGQRVIIKGDGSLSHGFEIVTRPMGRHYHIELWGGLLTQSVRRGLQSWDTSTCGLHTHIPQFLNTGKDASAVLAVEHPAIRNFVLSLAGRENSRWCKFHTIRNKADAGRYIGSRTRRSFDRYVAVNTNSRHNTHELRIFRGNLRPASILRAVEFAEAVWAFGEAEKSVRTEDGFLDFLKSKEESNARTFRWPNLSAFVDQYREVQSSIQREMRSRMWRERESAVAESTQETRQAIASACGNLNFTLDCLAEELKVSWMVLSLSCDQLARRLRIPLNSGSRCFAMVNSIPFIYEPNGTAWFAVSEVGLEKIASGVGCSVQAFKNRLVNNGWGNIAFDVMGHNKGRVA
jgi:hypothetical protein